MREDYTGEYDPGISFESFSRDTLIELLKAYAKLYAAADGFWYLAVKEKFDNEAALDCDIKVWERGVKYELDRLTKPLKIQGDDVVALMKVFQISPWFQLMDYEVEFKSKDDAVFTVTSCPTLASLEKEGTGREESICNLVEPMIFRKYADYFNPTIEVIPLKVPPRENKGGICCQWEFRLEK